MSTTINNPYVDPVLMKGLKEFEPSKNKAFVSAHKVDKKLLSTSYLGSDEKELEIEPEPEPVKKTKSAPTTKVEYELFDEEAFDTQMEEALVNVRKVAKFDQSDLIDSIIADFYDLNGILPSVNDLSAIFGRMKVILAEEAVEDAEDYGERVSDSVEEDSDYDETNWQDEAQVLADLEEDYYVDDEDELTNLQQEEAEKENKEIVKNLE